METIDQLQRKIFLPDVPQRVISLVPSLTELLFDIGLEKNIIGRTKFCIHPNDKVKNVQRIGGTKNINIDLIKSLHPDLIIANKEENVKEQIELLEKFCPVWISDISSVDDAFSMMNSFGNIFDVKTTTDFLIDSIRNDFNQLQSFKIKKVIYLIWQKPLLTIGGDTFIHQLLNRAGMQNVFNLELRYPEITKEQIRLSDAEYILLSSEPYPFKEYDKQIFEKNFPSKKIILVDGEMFSWYGSRMKKAAQYFIDLRKNLSNI